jgi:chorismate mutase
MRIIRSRTIRLARNVARIKDERNAYRLLLVKPEGKKPIRRPIREWIMLRQILKG